MDFVYFFGDRFVRSRVLGYSENLAALKTGGRLLTYLPTYT